MATDGKSNVVLIAVDGSKQAKHCLEYYLENIRRPEHEVTLLHCIELPGVTHPLIVPGQAHLAPTVMEEMWAAEVEKSKELEKEFSEILKSKGLHGFKFRTVSGLKPGEIIVEVANQDKACMIVMGTRGMGAIRRTILGSVSDYVIHHAHCAVVVCRHVDDKHHH